MRWSLCGIVLNDLQNQLLITCNYEASHFQLKVKVVESINLKNTLIFLYLLTSKVKRNRGHNEMFEKCFFEIFNDPSAISVLFKKSNNEPVPFLSGDRQTNSPGRAE